jgi:hypothetical protein
MSFKTGASVLALALCLGISGAVAQQAPRPAEPQPAPPAQATKTPVSGQIAAQPADTVLSRDIVGQTVHAPDNSKIGSISDLILGRDAKTVEGFVVGVGGFLGIGERNVALTMDKLRIAPQPDGSVKLTSDVTKEQLSNAPAFKSRRDMEAEKRAAERPPAGPGQRRPGQ